MGLRGHWGFLAHTTHWVLLFYFFNLLRRGEGVRHWRRSESLGRHLVLRTGRSALLVWQVGLLRYVLLHCVWSNSTLHWRGRSGLTRLGSNLLFNLRRGHLHRLFLLDLIKRVEHSGPLNRNSVGAHHRLDVLYGSIRSNLVWSQSPAYLRWLIYRQVVPSAISKVGSLSRILHQVGRWSLRNWSNLLILLAYLGKRNLVSDIFRGLDDLVRVRLCVVLLGGDVWVLCLELIVQVDLRVRRDVRAALSALRVLLWAAMRLSPSLLRLLLIEN